MELYSSVSPRMKPRVMILPQLTISNQPEQFHIFSLICWPLVILLLISVEKNFAELPILSSYKHDHLK